MAYSKSNSGKKRAGSRKGPKNQGSRGYPFEFRLKIARMYLEEGHTARMLSDEFGMSIETISRWAKVYQERGENGLKANFWCKTGSKPKRQSKVPAAVKEKIVALKKENPSFGIRRICDCLRRFFFLKASPSTARATLAEADLLTKKPAKPKRNPAKPRFFERATPNQMWQSDICCFRMAGKNAYLIGFIDDYSRYVVSMELYLSQTANNLLEVYRRGTMEYGPPREMLTDNGRQYTNWRGTTKFEKELKKDGVSHFRSRPHHPQTLGKIERFWKSILEEFLSRSRFDSLEEARERLALWIKYYNHKRPHQGIGGLCPADRYFEIQNELRETLAKGVEDNALELALRGKPRDPFYMVGRMGGQNVVISAEKGKVRMSVDGKEASGSKELVYDVKGKDSNHDDHEKEASSQGVRGQGEVVGGAVDLDGTAHGLGGLPGVVHQLHALGRLAEPGHGGHALGLGAQTQEQGASGPQPAAGEAHRTQDHQEERRAGEVGGPLGDRPEEAEDQGLVAPEGGDDARWRQAPKRDDDPGRSLNQPERDDGRWIDEPGREESGRWLDPTEQDDRRWEPEPPEDGPDGSGLRRVEEDGGGHKGPLRSDQRQGRLPGTGHIP